MFRVAREARKSVGSKESLLEEQDINLRHMISQAKGLAKAIVDAVGQVCCCSTVNLSSVCQLMSNEFF